MSIKKCIMNYFDKATNAMVPFHPQTESGAITDWHESIIGSLASKVLPTVVSELTTDSVMGKLMKMLLTASGVKYSIDTNGYVCLGSFFGGLIIQWGFADDSKRVFNYPLSLTRLLGLYYTGAYNIGFVYDQSNSACYFKAYNAELKPIPEANTASRFFLVIGV